MITPAIAPNTATTRLSVNIWRTSRQRVAPSAPRIANSHARNQQDENDRSEHSPDLLAKLHTCECVQQWLHACRREILICLRIVLCQIARKRDEFRIRLIESHPRL